LLSFKGNDLGLHSPSPSRYLPILVARRRLRATKCTVRGRWCLLGSRPYSLGLMWDVFEAAWLLTMDGDQKVRSLDGYDGICLGLLQSKFLSNMPPNGCTAKS